MDYLKLLLLIVIVNVLTPQNALSAPQLIARQDDEDGDLPEIALPILQIIGSALAGNASALIDNSIALIPSEISDTISSAINVLANAINSAKPPETTTKGTVKEAATSTSVPTTTEEDEDQEPPTTPAVDLRGNSSDATTKSPLTQSTIMATTTTWNDSPAMLSTPAQQPIINILNTESVTNQVNGTAARATERPTVANLAASSTTQRSVIINLDNPTTAAAIPVSIETQDSDNKANWISLITDSEAGSPGSLPNASVPPLNNVLILPSDVGQDNKANWASIFNSADLLQPSPASTPTTTRPTNIRGNNKQAGAGLGHDIVSSNRPLTSNQQPSRNPVINNLPTWILSSSSNSLSSNDAFKNKLVSILPSQQQMPQTLNYTTQVLQSFQKVNELLNPAKPSQPPPQQQQPASIAIRLPGGQTIQLNPALLALLNATSANGWNYNPVPDTNETTPTTILPETSSTSTTVTTTASTSTTEDDDDDDDDNNYDV